jgi:spermidine synthase
MKKFALIAAIFAAGFCGMIAEYSVSTVAGYLIGNSAAAFTVLISTFMLCMGVGAIASERVERDEVRWFLFVEIVLSILCSVSTVFLSQAAVADLTWEAALFTAGFVGMLIGFEIPLLMRINEQHGVVLKENVARVFAADYLGSFVAGLLFVPVFLPTFGTVLTPVIGGIVNLLVALSVFILFRPGSGTRFLVSGLVVALGVISLTCVYGETVVLTDEQKQYEDPIVYREQTRYQTIAITELQGEHCLYLNGQTQFCSIDEARYHEMLVHPAFALNPTAHRVLVLGGGDGIAVREVLKHPSTVVTLVDLDPRMTALASTNEILTAVNQYSLTNGRVTVVNADAGVWLAQDRTLWDIVLIDLPDPEHESLAKLYSLEFYRLVQSRLAPHGVMTTQSTSPYHAPEAFATIVRTVQETGMSTVPYRVNVPTFGDWGFTMATGRANATEAEMRATLDVYELRVPTKFLNGPAMQAATRFEKGILPEDLSTVAVNRRVRPTILAAYDKAWKATDD